MGHQPLEELGGSVDTLTKAGRASGVGHNAAHQQRFFRGTRVACGENCLVSGGGSPVCPEDTEDVPQHLVQLFRLFRGQGGSRTATERASVMRRLA